MVRRILRTRTAGAVLLAGWVLLPGAFVFAQTATSSTALGELIAKLQEQITALQSQVVELKSQLAVTQAELKFTKALRRGATGDEVKELQEFLKQFPDIYPTGLVTGFFGALTENAVKRFQEKFDIATEGIVGPKTRAKLNELTTEGAGASGLIPPDLVTAPGLQREGATGTPPTLTLPPPPTGATTTPPAPPPATPPSAATTTPALACAKTLNVPSEKYPTIQSALDAACQGDVIRIAASAYFGAFAITSRHSGVTITGAGLDQTVIQGLGAPVFTIESTSNIAIKNLTILRAGHPSTDGGGMRIVRSKNIALEHCRVSKSVGNEGGALAVDDSSSVTVTRCLFDANISTHSAGGIIVRKNSQATLTNVTVVANEARGCHGGGLLVDASSAATVKNAIFWGNSDTSPPGTACQKAPAIYGTPTVTYSDIERGFAGTGNINLTPYFASPIDGDFHILTPNSPVVNSGDPATIDPDGTRADMGVFPYGAAALPLAPTPAFVSPPPAPPPASATSTAPAPTPTPTPTTATTTTAVPPPAPAPVPPPTTATTTSATPPPSSSGTCPLTLTFANNKTSYTIGETAYITYGCSTGPSVSFIRGTVVKPDGTSTYLDYSSGGITPPFSRGPWGYDTTGLQTGTYTVKICLDSICQTVGASAQFTISTSSSPSSTATPPPAASTVPDIRTGTGSVLNDHGFPFPTGMMFYSMRTYGFSGYLYSTSYPTSPPVYFANVTSSASTATSSCDPSAPPENTYQGIANVCLFTSASNLAFSQPTAVRLYGKNSGCYRGILLFKQGNYYGGIDPEDVTAGGALNYRYWYDASGGSNFSSVCTAATPLPPPPPPPPPPATALPAPTYISADWGFTLGPLNKRNGTASQKIVFQYPSDNSAKTTIFRLYQKTPTDSSFVRAAEFTGIDSTACGGRSVVGEWILERVISCTSWVVSRVKAGTTESYPYEAGAGSFPASSYAVGEYSYYITAVNSAGEEGAPSATSKLVFFEPGTILAPTAAQSPVSSPPTFQWTVGSGWPSFYFNSYTILIFDDASPPGTQPLWGSCVPAGCRGGVIPGGVYSQVYNGPALDPAKKYRLSIYGYGQAEDVGGVRSPQYLALPRAVVDFWVQSATTTAAAAPPNLAAVLDAIARAIEALRQQIGKLR